MIVVRRMRHLQKVPPQFPRWLQSKSFLHHPYFSHRLQKLQLRILIEVLRHSLKPVQPHMSAGYLLLRGVGHSAYGARVSVVPVDIYEFSPVLNNNTGEMAQHQSPAVVNQRLRPDFSLRSITTPGGFQISCGPVLLTKCTQRNPLYICCVFDAAIQAARQGNDLANRLRYFSNTTNCAGKPLPTHREHAWNVLLIVEASMLAWVIILMMRRVAVIYCLFHTRLERSSRRSSADGNTVSLPRPIQSMAWRYCSAVS